MSNYTPNNQQNNQPGKNQSQSTGGQGSKQTAQSAPTADKPTPVSRSSQNFGTSSNQGTGQSSNQGSSQSGQSNRDSSITQEAKQTGRELADDAKRAVNDAARELKQQTDEVRLQAQEQATGFLSEQKDVAAQRVGSVAEALRQTGQQFADRDEGMLAHYTESLAGQLDNFSNSLRDREIGSLLDDAKELAHRQPELFVVGALAAGFAIGRFFKSSRRNAAYDYSYQDRGYGMPYDEYGYSRFGEEYETGHGRDYERVARGYGGNSRTGYGSGYSGEYGGMPEYDPRSSTRAYGEPYGQRYGDEFNQSRGPAYGRAYESGASSGQTSSSQTSSSQSSQGSRSQQQATFDQGSDQEYEKRISQARNSQWSSGEPPRNEQGEVTTHGLGTGQSVQREEDLKKGQRMGQEFGQGEEQISNYKGNETETGSQLAKDPDERKDRQEGQLR